MRKNERTADLLRETGEVCVAPSRGDRLEHAGTPVLHLCLLLPLQESFEPVDMVFVCRRPGKRRAFALGSRGCGLAREGRLRGSEPERIIPSDPEAICVHGAAARQAEFALKRLIADAVPRACDEVGKLDGLRALVYYEAAHVASWVGMCLNHAGRVWKWQSGSRWSNTSGRKRREFGKALIRWVPS